MGKLTRRDVIKGIAGTAGYLALLSPPAGARSARHIPIGLEAYTLGSDGLRSDLSGTLQTVRQMGYETIEMGPSIPGHSAKDVRQALDQAGLRAPSIMVPMEPYLPGMLSLAETAPVLDALRVLGAQYASVPMFPYPPRDKALEVNDELLDYITKVARDKTEADWRKVASSLNDKSRELSREGFKLCYHNHSVEFGPLPSGKTPYDILLAETDPKSVHYEMDVGWVMAAGVDPLELLKKHRDRFALLHLKDAGEMAPNTSLRITSARLGTGVGKWEPFLKEVVTNSNVQYVYVEQEPPYVPSRIEAARESYAYLKSVMDKVER